MKSLYLKTVQMFNILAPEFEVLFGDLKHICLPMGFFSSKFEWRTHQ